jgi:hypothetical protein
MGPSAWIRRGPVEAALVVALLVAACGGATAPSAAPPTATPIASADPDSAATVAALRAVPYGAANTDAAIEALGRSGVAVVERVTSTDPLKAVVAPAAPLRLTRWQVHALGLEAATGGGLTGAELDALIPVPERAPRTSRIVAGYLARVDSPGARLGRALLGPRDWTKPDEIVIPSLVLMTLSAELAREAAKSASIGAPAPAAEFGARLAAIRGPIVDGGYATTAGICSDVESFVDDTVSAVFDALKVKSDGSTAGDIAAGIWNFLVEIGEVIVKSVLEAITAPVLAVIRAVAGGVAVVGMIVAIVQPWALRVVGEPSSTRLAVGDEPGLPGKFEVTVDVGGIDDWPADVADCAALAGVPLPPIGAVGAQITWKPLDQDPGGLMTSGEADAVIPEEGPARLATTTGSEPAEVAQGDPQVGLVRGLVIVRRPGIRELRGALQSLLFAQLPSIVAAALQPILGPAIADLVDELDDIQDVKGGTDVSVLYHTRKETPPPETRKPAEGVRHPCDYVSTGDLNGIAEGDWSSSRRSNGAFQTCQFDDPGGRLIPPSFAVVSIATSYPTWDAIAKGADSEAVGGLGDEAYWTGSGQVLFVRKGNVVISTAVADMIVTDRDKGDFEVDPDADHDKAEALARLVLGKLP